MGWLKVKLRPQGESESIVALVVAVKSIVAFNQLSSPFLSDSDNSKYSDCICLSLTDDTNEDDARFVVCPSVDTFTRWVMTAEHKGYFDATVKLDPDSIPE